MRCFIAIEVPEAARKSIAVSMEGLKQPGTDIRWVSPENIHITIQFLGETEEPLIQAIIDALNKIVASYSPFYIKIAGIGYFPDRKRPRVVWVGTEGPQVLAELHADIIGEMARLGYQEEHRPFTAHITIGRVKSSRGMGELIRRIDEMKTTSFSSFEVQSVRLMKSELKPSGAKYYCLAEIPFGRRNNVNQGQRQ